MPLAPNQTPSAQTSAPPIDGVTPNAAVNPVASPRPHRLVLAAVCALVIGYAALSHYSASSPDAKGLGAALSVAPIFLIGLILAWRWTRPLTAVFIAAAACVVLYCFWPVIERNYEWGDLVQQCGAYALIAATFARSLFAGRVPICTQLANAIHGALTPVEIAYTYRATIAWAAFYILTAAAILVLFFVASLRAWSLFVNFGVFGLMILMGLVDHTIRRRVLPRHPGGGILAIVQRTLIG